MAREFKVGQIVKIRQWDDMQREYGLKEKLYDYSWDNIKIPGSGFTTPMKELCGKKATIMDIEHMELRNHDRIRIKFHDEELSSFDREWYYTADMVEPYIPTFEELVGKVIETRDGRRYLGVDTKDKGIIFCNYCGWFAASDRNNLLSRYHKDNDIMKVYKPECCKGCTLNSILEYVGTIIWERIEEEPIKEMTVADVEKLVGTKVKIVKEA